MIEYDEESDPSLSLKVFDINSTVEFTAPGYSRTGFDMWEHCGRRWFEYGLCLVSPVAITLEEKAAMTCSTGHWPSNDRAWRLLPRWQRAELWRQGIRSFGNGMGYRQARKYGREVLGYEP